MSNDVKTKKRTELTDRLDMNCINTVINMLQE